MVGFWILFIACMIPCTIGTFFTFTFTLRYIMWQNNDDAWKALISCGAMLASALFGALPAMEIWG